MRIRMLLLASLVVVAGVFGPAVAAHAQESGSKDISKEAQECIERLENGDEPKDCHEAPNPILPATNEIVWGSLSFVVLFYLLAKLAYPQLKKGMDARADKIRDSLDEAERTRTEAQGILEDYQRQLADAKGESGRIIEEARQAADAMRRELMAKAEAEALQVRERAQSDIQASVERAQADLRSQVAALAVEAAEMVVQRALTDRETQLQLVEDYINQVGSQRA